MGWSPPRDPGNIPPVQRVEAGLQSGVAAVMRFLMLNWRDPHNPMSGGAERVTQGYLEALARRGHEVSWFANAFDGCSRCERIGAIEVVRGGGPGRSILEARRWYRTQPRFDLVVDQHHGLPWYAPWWCGTPCVAYIHEVLGPIWNSFYRWPLNWIGQVQERWTHRLYRKVPFWTACESTERQLRDHGVRKVKILRYGVHTRAVERLEPKRIGRPLRLAVVSRLAPNKRIDHAIRAVHALRQRGVPAVLSITGGGDEEGGLRRLVAELGLDAVVEFKGRLPEAEKDAHLRDVHLLLHTSQREGWGLNVVEANAMGTPAAVYPVEGLIESTLDNVTGLLSKLETPESLADRIIGILGNDDLYQRLRYAAWERAKTLHWDAVLPPACDWLEAAARGEV